MHKPFTVSSSLLCYKKASKDCWKNAKNTTDFHANSNPLDDISLTRHAVMSCYCFKNGKWNGKVYVAADKNESYDHVLL